MPPFAQPSKDVDRDLARLYEAVSGARRIAVICGAGISVSSPANIPDFRSAHGLFKKLKEKHPTAGLSSGKDLFDARLFSSESTSALFYSMVAELKRLADEAEPTIFHRFLKRLDDEGRLQRVYTQNIDGLEEKVGLSFGLGEAGDSTTTVRALGKRKRAGEGAGWARSKSDSHLLFQNREEAAQRPMFPRTIPLHGTLQTLTCALCNHKLVLGNTVKSEEAATGSREGSASLGHEESKHAIELLQNGEPVPCPQCEEADRLRTIANMRSRGVGRMKVDIVLYGGQNEGAERVGQCLQRDILGLRDPNEPPVPESAAEMRARERKEKKEAAKLQLEQEVKREADQSIDSEGAVDTELGSLMPSGDSKDDILARAFAEEAGEKSVTIAEPVKPVRKKPTRPLRLKPLPPDLLIVAGTSLKVPGTKRIVREFAKACHAQDEWLIYSSESEDESSTAEDGSNSKKRKPRKKPEADEAEEDEEGEHEIHDPSTPIRTILLNYDFPNPAREWEDVFDVWIQGDLQRAALSLFPTKQVGEDAPQDAKVIEEIVGSYTWAKFKDYLEEQRALAKKEKRKAAVAATAGSLGARKGRGMGRTVSAAAKMERAGSSVSVDSIEGIVSSQVEVGRAAAKVKAAKARSRSESPVKKRVPQNEAAAAAAGGVAGGKKAALGTKGSGLKRSNSKKNPFLVSDSPSSSPAFGGSTVSVDIPTIAEEQEDEEITTKGQGKDRDGGTHKQTQKEQPSSCIAPSKRGWSRSVTLPTQPQLTVLIESQATNHGDNAAKAKGKTKQVSVKDVGVGVKPSTVYGKVGRARGKRSNSVGAAVKKDKWSRTQSETACL